MTNIIDSIPKWLVITTAFVLLSSCKETKEESAQTTEPENLKTKVTAANFTVAETDKYFTEHASKYPVNTLHHNRVMSGVNHQFVIRENQDTMYSNGLVDVSQGATISNPPWDVYSSIQVIDENHYTVAVLYPGDTLTITKDMLALGNHVYLNIRTGVRTLDSLGYAEAHKHQDSYSISAVSANPYVSKGFDQRSLDSMRNVLLEKAVDIKAWKAFGSKSEVDSLDFLLGSAAGWAGLPIKHATYVTQLAPTGEAIKGACSRLTIPKPPLQFDKGGFFSVTTYGPDGYIVKEKFALNNKQATPNPDGSYTFHFNCDKAKNNIEVVENWNMTLRLYMPESEEAILAYAATLVDTQEIEVIQ